MCEGVIGFSRVSIGSGGGLWWTWQWSFCKRRGI